jgi:hypothetical protein
VDPGAHLDLVVRVARDVIPLEPLTVTALSRRLERVGFYTRQRTGQGAFLTRADIEKMPAVSLASDIVRQLSGVRLVRRQGGGRGFRLVGRNQCPYRYFVDDVPIGPGFELDDLEWHWIEAIEVYNGLGQIPPQYMGGGPMNVRFCGVVVVWTRQVGG